MTIESAPRTARAEGRGAGAEAEWEGFPVSLPSLFEGPLDLLLHLVKTEKVEIAAIEVGRITDAYLEYLRMMQDLDLDVAGDFVVMAATLLHLKAQALLPAEEAPAEDEEITREELIRLLLEYKRFKEAAGDLEARAMDRARWFLRGTSSLPPPTETLSVDLQNLLEAFRGVLARAPREVVAEIARAKITVEERVLAVRRALEAAEFVPFEELFRDAHSRAMIIATFLALLETIKLGVATARQTADRGEIRIYRGPAFGRPSGEETEPTEVPAAEEAT